MPPEDPANSELDQPLDAIVYDVHPALLAQPAYPYAGHGSRSNEAGDSPFQVRPEDLYRPTPLISFQRPAPARYKVPKRFGMSAILGITTALALLFGGLRLMDAPPVVYLFFGVQAILICIVQMFHGGTPRIASAIAGAIILPLFVMSASMFVRGDPPLVLVVCVTAFCVPFGAFLGYLTGTCAAGIFLVMEALEPYLQGSRPIPGTPASHSAAARPV